MSLDQSSLETSGDPSSSSSSLKRKATADLAASAPRRIQRLDEAVVNKIAAGEIIVAPVHALKELIENAVDAGSTTIDVLVKDGGLKLLQITDNGCGINKEDLPILCERFTTSKLKTFDDLSSIGTYGFRGEALASISHIAHLTVTTKTKDSDRAWRAVYQDGKLMPARPGQKAEAKAVAGKNGTQLTVEDLFYNMPNRRKAFRSSSEEYNKILDVVGRYAVHCTGVGFSCKKFGDADMGVSVQAGASTIDRIRHVYGASLANELVKVETESKSLGYKAQAHVSNANYNAKKTQILLFINHRAVESHHVKKAIEQTYQAVLPKGGHPFVYISLEIEPHRVDVNIHPTKREVNFLNEDDIIQELCEAISNKLAAVDTSRTFLTQTLLPNAGQPQVPDSGTWKTSGPGARKIYENNLNRVDHTTQKITALFKEKQRRVASQATDVDMSDAPPLPTAILTEEPAEWTPINYKSIRKLREQVQSSLHNQLYEIFHNHTFVGIVDESRRFAAIQHGVKLYLVDYGAMCYNLFYQIGLSDFANFGRITFPPPGLPLQDLLDLAAETERLRAAAAAAAADSDDPQDFSWTDATATVRALLIDKRAMLDEYFSLKISADGYLETAPLLLAGYVPPMGKLPGFLLRLGPNVDWSSEYECFRTFLHELAVWYVPERLPRVGVGEGEGEGVDPEVRRRHGEVMAALEDVVFPAARRRLVPGRGMLSEVQEVANLKGLYRIFERC